ncbi:uncharacterized protein LOC142345140 [Convolutriloba macropyga]|uniref:uncharacterized protein LOC142345140 n=1 Tax=Convolutriloba macropyga TaxID=536237 RepID=UPI003F51F477
MEPTIEDAGDDLYSLELSVKIMSRGVFPFVAFWAASCNYFLMFTVIDLGLDRASMVFMGCVAGTDFFQLLGLIYFKFADGSTFGCITSRWIFFFATHLAQNQLAILNLDRFVAMFRYQWYSENLMHNKNYCCLMVAINFVISFALTFYIPFLQYYDPVSDTCLVRDDSILSPYFFIFLGLRILSYLVVPLLILIPTNYYISRKLRSFTTVTQRGMHERDFEAESMFTKGAVAYATSFTTSSLLTVTAFLCNILIKRGVILQDKTDVVKSLYADLATEAASIFAALNMTVAFVTFTLQSRAFRIALIAEEYREWFFGAQ